MKLSNSREIHNASQFKEKLSEVKKNEDSYSKRLKIIKKLSLSKKSLLKKYTVWLLNYLKQEDLFTEEEVKKYFANHSHLPKSLHFFTTSKKTSVKHALNNINLLIDSSFHYNLNNSSSAMNQSLTSLASLIKELIETELSMKHLYVTLSDHLNPQTQKFRHHNPGSALTHNQLFDDNHINQPNYTVQPFQF